MPSALPVEVLLRILFLATPRSHCYTREGRKALVDICLTCKLWQEAIYESPLFWTSFSLSVDDIDNFKKHLAFLTRWFDRAGGMKLSLLVEEQGKGVDYDDDFGIDIAPHWSAYEWFLTYSGRWERVVFDTVQFSWLHGLMLVLEMEGGLEGCFKNVTHFCAKATGNYNSHILPLEFMPRLESLGIKGRGRFQSLYSIHAGVWSNLKDLEFTIRGDHIFWYPPIVLGKLKKLHFYGVVYIGPFFEKLTLSSLKSLCLRQCFIPDTAEWETAADVAALLECSRCSLEQLVFTDAAVTNEGLVKLLKGIPSLKSLSVEARKKVDCRFLSDLRDDLPHLTVLRLTLLHADTQWEDYAEFVADERRWWSKGTEMEDDLVEHELARAADFEDQERMALLENTFLLMKELNVVGDGYEGMFCAYNRGFDRGRLREAEEDIKYTCRPSW